MKFLKKIRKDYYEYIYNSSIPEKDRTFAIVSSSFIVAVILAMIVGIILREPL